MELEHEERIKKEKFALERQRLEMEAQKIQLEAERNKMFMAFIMGKATPAPPAPPANENLASFANLFPNM
jgi:hypothetical protein